MNGVITYNQLNSAVKDLIEISKEKIKNFTFSQKRLFINRRNARLINGGDVAAAHLGALDDAFKVK